MKEDNNNFLFDALVLGTSQAIQAQEARGQRNFVQSELIPTKGPKDDVLTALGFRLGPTVAGDPLFRTAELPEGWRKVASDHDMWSYIVDDKGRRRIGVFYKAAFYDRRADMHLERRYVIGGDTNSVMVLDGETVIHSVPYSGDAYEIAERWLEEHFPDYQDPLAYWA